MNEVHITKKIISNRTELIEILVPAFIIGIIASLFATLIFNEFKNSPFILFLFTLIVLILSFLFLSKKLNNQMKSKIEIKGFFIHNKTDNVLLDIPMYNYGEKLHEFMKSAFLENEALKKQWDKEPIDSIYDFDKKTEKFTKKNPSSLKLINEATEYYIIDKLSTHLTDYFNVEKFDTSELKEFAREDVSDILLSNRFMELFTGSMENRTLFDNDNSNDKHGTVVFAMGENGAIYHRFDLVLPKDSMVTRELNNTIKINTKNFILKINVNFDGCGFVTPRNFDKHYLGIKKSHEYSEYKVNITVDVIFKISSLFNTEKWDYHSWIDGFLKKLISDINGDDFFEKINWNTVSTIIQCGQTSKLMPNKTE